MQTQPAAQSQNVGPVLPFHPPKTPRCINPLVEARWAPAIIGRDQWNWSPNFWESAMETGSWVTSVVPEAKDPQGPYSLWSSWRFTLSLQNNKNSHDFLILSLPSLIPFTPTLDNLDTLQVLLDISYPRIAKTPFCKDSLTTYAAFVQWFI